MQLTVKGNHLNVGNSLRRHVEDHLSTTAEKYFRNPIEATVIFTKEKNRFHVEISLHVGGGIVLQSHNEANDPYPAFDTAMARMATRLRRYKEKLRDHRRHEKGAETQTAAYTTLETGEYAAENGDEPVIVAELELQLMTLAVSDAVMHLELRDLPALLFRNPKHGGYNLVYRRKDGNIGWIDPDGALKKKPAAKSKAPANKNKTTAKSKGKTKVRAISRAAVKPAPRKAAGRKKK